LCAYEDRVSHAVHLALVRGQLDGPDAPLVRVHVADTLRDALGITGDGRSWTLRRALERVATATNGVVVILREAEAAYDLAAALQALQRPSGSPGDTGVQPSMNAQAMVLRTFGVGAQILKDLGVCRMRVMSQPKQMHGLSAFGLTVEAYVGADS
jgi:3,4-dihydroxy 2-butanone 4-phosphate synthase / GTP cyclohydrolase II